MRRALVLLLAAAAVVLPACGGDNVEQTQPIPKGDATVTAKDFAFTPKQVRLAKPGTYTIVLSNRDKGIAHDLHVLDAPGSPHTDLITGRAVATVKVTFPAPGTYHFRCDPHPVMKGTIIVG